MNRRTLILAAAAASIGLLYGADQAYRSLIERPMEKDEIKLARLTSNTSKAKDAQIEGMKASKRLDAFNQYSLPADPELARSAYQDWLLKLTKSHELEDSSVGAGDPLAVTVKSRGSRSKRRLVYHRITFNLSARGTLDQVTRFMFAFYQAGHLHKVKAMSLNPIGRQQLVDLSLTIEAISLADCEREGELSEGTLNRLAFEDLEPYQFIARRNMFARGFSKALAEVELTALTVNRSGQAEAWFAVGSDRKTQVIEPGEELSLELHEATLVDVQNDVAVVNVDGTLVRMKCGQSLGEAMALQSASNTALR